MNKKRIGYKATTINNKKNPQSKKTPEMLYSPFFFWSFFHFFSFFCHAQTKIS